MTPYLDGSPLRAIVVRFHGDDADRHRPGRTAERTRSPSRRGTRSESGYPSLRDRARRRSACRRARLAHRRARQRRGAGSRGTHPRTSTGHRVTGYVVTPFLGSVAQPSHTFHSAAPTETVTGLTNGQTYTFEVAAINANGTGPRSDDLQQGASSARRSRRPTSRPSPNRHAVALTWQRSDFDERRAGHRLRRDAVHRRPAPRASTTSTRTRRHQTITGLHSGTVYTFKVAAKNQYGTGPRSRRSNRVKPTSGPDADPDRPAAEIDRLSIARGPRSMNRVDGRGRGGRTRAAAARTSSRPWPPIAMALPDAVLVVDSGAQVRWANRAAERLFGMPVDEAIGQNGLDFIHPDDLQLAVLALTSVQAKEVGSLLELRVRSADGWRLVEMIGAPLGDNLVLSVARPHRAPALGGRRRRSRALPLADAERGVGDDAPDARRRRRVVVGRPDPDPRARPGVARAPPARRRRRRTRPRRARRRARTTCSTSSPDRAPAPVTIDVRLPARVRRHGSVRAHVHEPARRPDGRRPRRDRPRHHRPGRGGHRPARGELGAGRDARVDRRRHPRRRRARAASRAGTAGSPRCGGSRSTCSSRATTAGRSRPCSSSSAIPAAFVAKVQGLYEEPEAHSHDLLEFKDGRVFERDSLPQRIDGEVVGRVWSFRDVTEHRRLQNELTHQAFHDPLTGLANQALFRDRVDHAATAAPAPRRAARGAVHRPRRLQDRQRQPRPLGRRRAARDRERAAHELPARGRHRGPARRRRVRGADGRARRPQRRDRRRRAHHHRAAGAGRARRVARLGDREHRHRVRIDRRRLRRDAPQRRPRDVHGQGRRQELRARVRARDAPRRGRAARPRSAPPRRGRTRRADGALPAHLRAAVGPHHRARGARSLAAPRARAARPALVHPVRRGGRPHRRDRPARARSPRARRRRAWIDAVGATAAPSVTRERRAAPAARRRGSPTGSSRCSAAAASSPTG